MPKKRHSFVELQNYVGFVYFEPFAFSLSRHGSISAFSDDMLRHVSGVEIFRTEFLEFGGKPYFNSEQWEKFKRYLEEQQRVLPSRSEIFEYLAATLDGSKVSWLNPDSYNGENFEVLRKDYLRFRVHDFLVASGVNVSNEENFFRQLVEFINDDGQEAAFVFCVAGKMFEPGEILNPDVDPDAIAASDKLRIGYEETRIFFEDGQLVFENKGVIVDRSYHRGDSHEGLGTLTVRVSCAVGEDGDLTVDPSKSEVILETDQRQLLKWFDAAVISPKKAYPRQIIDDLCHLRVPKLASDVFPKIDENSSEREKRSLLRKSSVLLRYVDPDSSEFTRAHENLGGVEIQEGYGNDRSGVCAWMDMAVKLKESFQQLGIDPKKATYAETRKVLDYEESKLVLRDAMRDAMEWGANILSKVVELSNLDEHETAIQEVAKRRGNLEQKFTELKKYGAVPSDLQVFYKLAVESLRKTQDFILHGEAGGKEAVKTTGDILGGLHVGEEGAAASSSAGARKAPDYKEFERIQQDIMSWSNDILNGKAELSDLTACQKEMAVTAYYMQQFADELKKLETDHEIEPRIKKLYILAYDRLLEVYNEVNDKIRIELRNNVGAVDVEDVMKTKEKTSRVLRGLKIINSDAGSASKSPVRKDTFSQLENYVEPLNFEPFGLVFSGRGGISVFNEDMVQRVVEYLIGRAVDVFGLGDKLYSNPDYHLSSWKNFEEYLKADGNPLGRLSGIAENIGKKLTADLSSDWFYSSSSGDVCAKLGCSDNELKDLQKAYLRFRVHNFLAESQVHVDNEEKIFQRLVEFMYDRGDEAISVFNTVGQLIGLCPEYQLSRRRLRFGSDFAEKSRIFFEDGKLVFEDVSPVNCTETSEDGATSRFKCGRMIMRVYCDVGADGDLTIDRDRSQVVLDTKEQYLQQWFDGMVVSREQAYPQRIIDALSRKKQPPLVGETFSRIAWDRTKNSSGYRRSLLGKSSTLLRYVDPDSKEFKQAFKNIGIVANESVREVMRAWMQMAIELKKCFESFAINPQTAVYADVRKVLAYKEFELMRSNVLEWDASIREDKMMQSGILTDLSKCKEAMQATIGRMMELTCKFTDLGKYDLPTEKKGQTQLWYALGINALQKTRAVILIRGVREFAVKQVYDSCDEPQRNLRFLQILQDQGKGISEQVNSGSDGLSDKEMKFLTWLGGIEEKLAEFQSIVCISADAPKFTDEEMIRESKPFRDIYCVVTNEFLRVSEIAKVEQLKNYEIAPGRPQEDVDLFKEMQKQMLDEFGDKSKQADDVVHDPAAAGPSSPSHL